MGIVTGDGRKIQGGGAQQDEGARSGKEGKGTTKQTISSILWGFNYESGIADYAPISWVHLETLPR